ncbi:hypothetical protein BEWA_049980 [Theileria equi strain WA]|uniref:Uncharacterized protein n=1 Tax=Theileria equi strain WA TaxID=1537102 RepID=L1LB80_THEEQ|nr:hypothetical protein BEWA_049980 [Theileria equi strain WA]EKX72530.1 hypothetical protein BEWA_049980 [Theileria equi strain WA]|eukprot:XP_004831982.1 hypothetical protein BEWA_049980 [Theileria equi strain WA]
MTEDKTDARQRASRSATMNIVYGSIEFEISKDVDDPDVTCVEKKKKGYNVGKYCVILTKELDPILGKECLQEYKCYTHSKPRDLDPVNYYFYTSYNRFFQNGIKIDPKSFKSLSVYYFTHDTKNTTPLFVEVNQKRKEYYNPTSTDVWINIGKLKGSKLDKRFRKIVKNIDTYPVVVNVDYTNGYYINGYEEDNYIRQSKIPRITVKYTKNIPYGYTMSIHTIYSQVYVSGANQLKYMKVLYTLHKGQKIIFQTDIPSPTYNEVRVYYWSLNLEQPLILQVGYDFYYMNGDYWIYFSYINERTLSNYLDSANCMFNSAHIFDMNKFAKYKCVSCFLKDIFVERITDKTTNCVKFTHKLEEKYSFNKIENRSKLQKGLQGALNVSEVSIYYDCGKPTLIEINSAAKKLTYERNKEKQNEWNTVESSNTTCECKKTPEVKPKESKETKLFDTLDSLIYSSVALTLDITEITDKVVTELGHPIITTTVALVNESLKSDQNLVYDPGGTTDSGTGESQSAITETNNPATIIKIVVGGVSGSIIALLGGLETLAFFKYPNKSVIRSLVGMFNKSLDYKPLEQLNGLIFLGTQNLGTSVTHFYQNIPKNVV